MNLSITPSPFFCLRNSDKKKLGNIDESHSLFSYSLSTSNGSGALLGTGDTKIIRHGSCPRVLSLVQRQTGKLVIVLQCNKCNERGKQGIKGAHQENIQGRSRKHS